jgi:hypothetical protein
MQSMNKQHVPAIILAAEEFFLSIRSILNNASSGFTIIKEHQVIMEKTRQFMPQACNPNVGGICKLDNGRLHTDGTVLSHSMLLLLCRIRRYQVQHIHSLTWPVRTVQASFPLHGSDFSREITLAVIAKVT